jgi:5-hydroxyisourate hydrolase-like protein (transthyretin family)
MSLSSYRFFHKTIPALLKRSRILGLFLLAAALAPTHGLAAGISLVQHTSKDAGTTTTSSLAFVNPNTTGNWIAVCIRGGWPGEVFTVTDSIGNTYRQAVLSSVNGLGTMGIFYAENIKGGANTITVSDTTSATWRVAILEYSGVATSNSLDVAASAQGTSTSPNSGNASTTANGDLLIGEIGTKNAASFTVGAGYTIEESVPAEPNSKLIAEDQILSTAGLTSAGASLGGSDVWGAVLAAFKAASGTAGSPSTITATAGTPQSAAVNTAFATQLQATVKDSQNAPVGGVQVTFTAPASGASGAFAGGLNTATTNASGVATAAVFTANSTAGGPYIVTATVAGVATPANFSLTNLASAPASITATAGTPQSASINSAFATRLQATVKDGSSNPVSGVTVTFTAPSSGASGTFTGGMNTATTNAQGVATAPLFTANSTAGGPYTVTATVAGVATAASFSLTNLASSPTYALSVSISSDRKYYVSGLQGALLSGNAFIFTALASQLTNFNPTGITSVSYWLDNPAMTGSPMHTQSVTPYDFAGPTNIPAPGLANPWDTTTVPDGTHTITQLVSESSGSSEADTATFTIQNNLSISITSGRYEYVFPDQSIYVYDLATFQLVKHVSMPQLTAVRGVGVVPSTHMLYISYGGAGGSNGTGSLLKYDLLTDKVIWTQSYTFGVDAFAITPDGTTIYMPDGASSGDGIWEVLDASTGAVTGSINTGMNGPHNTIVSLDGAKVFMGPINSADLVESNTSTNTVALNIGPLHQGVRPFSINGKHTLAFTTSNTASGIGFQVSDTTTGNVLYSVDSGFTIPSGFTFNTPVHGISLSPNEKEIYLIDTANAYAHVFDVSGLPSIAPTVIAHIPLTTNFSGFESPCSPLFNCVQESWIRHTLDGHYVLVDDSGDVIDTTTRQVVNTIPQLFNTRKGNMEIDWQNGLPVATSTHFGLGYVTSTGAPASVTAIAGKSQSATINTAFATQLQAMVRDAANYPVSGITVTFTAPASGASGTFAGGVNTATTNAQGVATAPIFTANGTGGGPYHVTASVAGVATMASFSLTNVAAPSISVVQAAQGFSASGNTSITVPMSTTPGNLLVIFCMNGGNNAATVTISDSAGQSWTQTTSGYASSASTNRSAMFYRPNSAAVTSVTATWTASANNIGAIVYELAGADTGSPADGSVNSNVSGSGILSLTSGSLTTANANDILIYGARTQSNETTWTAGSGYTIPTNGGNTRQGMQYGIVSSTQSGVTTSQSWNSGTTGAIGIFAAFKAASGGVAGPTITATAGTPQGATINTAFATNLQATVMDASNKPVSGVIVTFTPPASGASGTFAGGVNTATTNASGVATSAVFTANSVAGSYNVVASAPNATPVNFALTNTAGPAAKVTATSGTAQSATINTGFAAPLVATVTDSANNPVSGVTVTFAAPASGASGTFAGGVNTATTNAQGVATASIFTANSTVGGPYNVTASVTGVATTANFSLTNVAASSGFIALVQHTSKDAGVTSSTTLAFNANNIAGNWIGVIVRVGNGSQGIAITVTDSNGNTYHQAVQMASSPIGNLAIFYAENSKAGVNTITVSDNISATLRVAIFEYSGVMKANSLDVTVSAQGTSTAPNSGNVTTTANGDLLLGAVMTTNAASYTAGSSYVIEENVPVEPGTKLLVEDELQTAAGAVAASATLAASDNWGAVLAAFKSANGLVLPISVSVSPTTASVPTAYGTQSFTASVVNDSTNRGVTWSLSGTGCTGITCGSLSNPTTTSVNYNAPANVPNPATVSLTATAVADNTKAAAATITVAQGVLNVAIRPRQTAITVTQTQQFTATVTNNPQNFPVTWVVDGVAGGGAATGTITAAGLYTPPNTVGTHTVTAQVQAQSASAATFVTNYPGTFMRDVDTFRTGQNLGETALAPANVNVAQFGKLLSYSIDGVSDASPLYAANVNIPGQGVHNVVYVETEHDSVYAFDADGLITNPLWKVTFINPAAGITTITPADTGDCCPPNMPGESGITGTPVIDPATGTLYVVAVTKEVSGTITNFVQRLHALDITTGAEKFGGPVVIQASVPGTGDGSSGGQVPFDALHENQRAALLLTNGIVYIAWGAHADRPPYHGWVLGYSATTLQQVMVYNTTPNGSNGGIWQSGDGLTTDSTGRLYFVTGNGLFDANMVGGLDYGDSIVAITTTGTVSDYFTPHDQSTMASSDLDLGSGGALLLPDQGGAHPHEALSSGKNGTIYVVDRDNMGHFNISNDNQIVQTLVNTLPGGTFQTGNFKSPVYFNGHVYFSADADTIKAFAVTNGLLSTSPTSQTSLIPGYPGATLQISANGSTNGILWAVQRIGTDQLGHGTVAPGALHAYDASNLATELYNSNQAAGGRDQLDFAAKWAAPLIANGKVFVATNSQLTIFGLLP